jgi:dTDP-4-dehydrorhamnose reductase|tara:strand:- start:4494 stop:5183 length:690 start_codon:yes stop_codon:yes gene_type:complete
MLGSTVLRYLSSVPECHVETVETRWPSSEFKNYLIEFSGDVIVNCIGAIPQRTNTFDINFELPIWIDQNASCSVIHAGTDCESDEDLYGASKRQAADYFMREGQRTKSIKCSIIGTELTSKQGLLEWFLASENELYGYTHQMWNGITTLQWAKICWDLIRDFQCFSEVVIPYSECISKFNLLTIMKDVYGKDIKILENDKIKINKCLVGNTSTPSIKEQLLELKGFNSK